MAKITANGRTEVGRVKATHAGIDGTYTFVLRSDGWILRGYRCPSYAEGLKKFRKFKDGGETTQERLTKVVAALGYEVKP